MSQLHINNSFEEQQKKSYSKQLARGLALLKQAVSDNYKSTQGTVNQSIRLGLASSVGLGGAYVAASKLASKVKTIAKGIHAITHFSGDSNDVEEENVFSHTEQTKQPGFWGIAGLAKYGFKHIVKAIKKKRVQEEKDKKSFFRKLLNGVKTLIKSKWFWLTLLGGAVTAGIWSLISHLRDKHELLEAQQEAAENRTLIDDPDFLEDAAEEAFYNEFEETLNDLRNTPSRRIQDRWNRDIDQLNKKIDYSTPQPLHKSSVSSLKGKKSPALNKSLPQVGNVPFQQSSLERSPLPDGSYTISSRFGYRDISAQNKNASHQHKGIDLAAKAGTPVIAPAKGKVIGSGFAPVSGNWVKIQHDDGYQTVYLHLQNRNVEKGQQLFGGEQIGTVGNTGTASTGAHLHYGVKQFNPMTGNYDFVNPEKYMSKSTTLTPLAAAVNAGMSSNNITDTLMADALKDSKNKLVSSINNLDKAFIYHIENPDEKFKKLVKKK